MKSQLIKVKTTSGAPIYIDICADDDDRIFVLMNVTAFTVGTYFESAEKALTECIGVINQVINYRSQGDRVEALHSQPGGAFLTNEAMTNLIPKPTPPAGEKQ